MLHLPSEKPLPSSHQAALQYMAKPSFMGTARQKAQAWRADRSIAHPDILAFERAFVRRMAKLKIPMFAHCVYRSPEGQQFRYNAGTSKAKPGQSPHQKGRAVDLVHGLYAWQVPKSCWAVIGHIGFEVAKNLGVKLVWGGDDPGINDKFSWDPAHWELEDWKHYPMDAQVSPARLEEVLAFYGLGS